jgi:putative protease
VRLSGLSGLGHRFPFEVAAVIIDLNADNLAQYRPAKQHRHPPLVWALPPIIAEEQLPWYQRAIVQLRQMGADRFQISHVVQSALFAEDRCSPAGIRLELYGDYSCNLLNSPALHEAASLAMAGVQFSVETDRGTLAAALSSYAAASGRKIEGERLKIGLLLHGRPPLFTARLDAPHFQGHRTLVSSRDERFYLDRRPDALYVRSHTVFSLLPYVSDLARIGLDYYVVDLSQGPLKRECAEVIALLSGRGDRPAVFSGNYSGILA